MSVRRLPVGLAVHGSLRSVIEVSGALVAVFSLAVNMQSAPAAQPVGMGALMGDPVMWLCALTLMFWVPIESSTAAWTTTFVNGLAPAGEAPERSRRIAAWTLSGFWLCFMGARLFTAFVFHSSELPVEEVARKVAMAHTVQASRVAHIVLLLLLPSVVDADLSNFGRALSHIQEITGRWFSAGDRQDWSYLLPKRLGRGRYRLEAYGIDGVLNRGPIKRIGFRVR